MQPNLIRTAVALGLAIIFGLATESLATQQESVWYWFQTGVHFNELNEYPSPDGRLKSIIISLPKAPYGSGESRIEIRSADGSLLFSQDYASEDGEHGFGVEHAAWTPDSKFFIYSLSSSGGHQPWHFPTDFIEVSGAGRSRLHQLDDYVGPITDPDFKVLPPDTVCTEGMRDKDLKETTFRVRLSELVSRKK